jgi:carbamoyltransferase
MTNAYWGPEYSRSEIEKELKEAKVEYHFLTDIQQYVAKELAEGKIVGWFQGRSELGPRALGNRSILAHPGMKGMKDKINNEVKHREYWRPFAPSILDEVGKEYFEHYCFHPFMILAFKATEKGKKALSQTLHIDYTGRVQSVTKQSNEKYYNLIKAFAKITNIPALLNTSFNDAEEPLVNTPRQALKTFFGSGMDMLAIGDYIVKKRR